ncbi:MAG: FMN-binding negative transcriptional regulator [Burkholderiales bacterium]|nr:FMN-binding negative transcriptional regulator [Burkholderiales bacterium]
MYIPNHFSEADQARIGALIHDFGFATLISTLTDGLQVTHAPVQYDQARSVLIGHLARANPHAAALQDGTSLLAIFHGPHSYISPAWYIDENPRVPNVPTWNYATVHVTGTITRIDDDVAKWNIVKDLAAQYEAGSSTPWDPHSLGAHASKLGAIVGFEIAITKIEAKLKLSQNRSVQDQESVIAKLATSTFSEVRATGEMMQENLARK